MSTQKSTFLDFLFSVTLMDKQVNNDDNAQTARLLENVAIFVDGKIYISLNIGMDGSQPTCIYQLRVSSGPHIFCLGLALVELVKNTWTIDTHFYYLAMFTKLFRQVKQVQALNKNYEDLC